MASLSEDALTAVSLAFPWQNLMIAVGVGTGVGVNAWLSRCLGEKDQRLANATAENGIFLALASYLVFAVTGMLISRPFFTLQTSSAVIAEEGFQYMWIVSVFGIGLFLQTMNEKKSRRAFFFFHFTPQSGIGERAFVPMFPDSLRLLPVAGCRDQAGACRRAEQPSAGEDRK